MKIQHQSEQSELQLRKVWKISLHLNLNNEKHEQWVEATVQAQLEAGDKSPLKE
jgi:hypothetical protein